LVFPLPLQQYLPPFLFAIPLAGEGATSKVLKVKL
jgi:hypothetical protein